MGFLVSLPISLLLLWVVLRAKKNDPFPKGGLRRLLIAGAVSTAAAVMLYMLLASLLTVVLLGPGTVMQLLRLFRDDQAKAVELMHTITAARVTSPLWTLFTTLITAGLMEELCKYLACREAINKEGIVRTWMDAVVCFTVVALVFELLENLLYGGQGSVLAALIRNLVPLHFSCGVIMGWYYGKSLATGEKKYRRAAVLVPTLIHTFYDTALNLMPAAEESAEAKLSAGEAVFILLGLFAFLGAFVLSLVVLIKFIQWYKKGTLNVSLSREPES